MQKLYTRMLCINLGILEFERQMVNRQMVNRQMADRQTADHPKDRQPNGRTAKCHYDIWRLRPPNGPPAKWHYMKLLA